MAAPKAIWADLPSERRIDLDFLLTRKGSEDPKWLEHQLQRIERADRGEGCPAAVPWFSAADRFAPCIAAVARGHTFCGRHGGQGAQRTKPRYCTMCGTARVHAGRYAPCDRCQDDLTWFETTYVRR